MERRNLIDKVRSIGSLTENQPTRIYKTIKSGEGGITREWLPEKLRGKMGKENRISGERLGCFEVGDGIGGW